MKIPSVKGFHDVLPDESARWAALEAGARSVFARYDFSEIRLPMVERTELFRRSIGEATDIVEKEMYSFTDRDGSSITLRPEGTASVVRAYVEHSLHAQEAVAKLYYFGPMFRRERPQKGRQRQFSQIGVEVIGRDDPGADAEILVLLYDLLGELGIDRPKVLLNSLGDGTCKPAYRKELVDWGRRNAALLCEDCGRRLEQNPLRLLDCKKPDCSKIRHTAPTMIESLCAPCKTHFETVLELVRATGMKPESNPYMVRGLDYYCRTAFEVVSSDLGAQDALGGGGRYDGLVAELGGPKVAGIGFALGVERLLMVGAGAEVAPARPEFVIAPRNSAAEREAIVLAHRLRGGGARVDAEPHDRSLKSQLRHADKLGARYVVIIGEDELDAGRMTVRDMELKLDRPLVASLGATAAELRAALAADVVAPLERHA